ncbi:MAG: hypothetical protein EBU80_10735 [Chitinophagia bacterium]|jgi:hypothetical protein|nr:hypothetical protein [Chitinophagia bacterium]
MTIEQQKQVEIYRNEFEESCSSNAVYGSGRLCSFGVFKSENEEDQNVTLIITTITGLSDNYQPYVGTNNIMIEPDGNTFNMDDVFPSSQVAGYVSKLKKIENG